QRTQRLRFGPLVYTLPLHHPVRVAEEMCMLDELSGGRFELGVGRGISPIETAYYGVNPDNRQKMYLEALQILHQALTGRTLTFHGEFYHYADVPIELEPFQKPHPPFWAGAGTPDGAEAAGRNGFHLVANALTSQIRTMTDRYRAAFKAAHTPMLGLARFVIMGETDAEALTIARRAYPLWHRHFHHLFHMHGTSPAGGERPPHFDQIKDGGRGGPARHCDAHDQGAHGGGRHQLFRRAVRLRRSHALRGAAHRRSVHARGDAGAQRRVMHATKPSAARLRRRGGMRERRETISASLRSAPMTRDRRCILSHAPSAVFGCVAPRSLPHCTIGAFKRNKRVQ